MLFGIVYTRRHTLGAADASPDLFTSWRPPIDFVSHWAFSRGGGMGLIEASSSGELEQALDPFTEFFEFMLERVERVEPTLPALARERDRVPEMVALR